MTREEQLYARLKTSQGKEGYHFNKDMAVALELLGGLLANRKRYGYMSCPCRLAAGDLASDRDIVCPCAYREADIREFGSCYCGLYVSEDWNDGTVDHVCVPERRPPEKIV